MDAVVLEPPAANAPRLVAYYFAKTVLYFAAGLTLVGYAALVMFAAGFEAGGIWFAAALALLGLFTFFRAVKKRQTARREKNPFAEQDWPSDLEPRAQNIVGELCAVRRIRPPRVVIEETFCPTTTPSAGMRDVFFGCSELHLNARSVEHLSPDELRAVVAHELRHYGALSTKMRGIYLLLHRAFFWFWLEASLVYAGAVLFTHPGGTAEMLGDLALSLLVGAALYKAAAFAAEMLNAAMCRADEAKTDILSCADTGRPDALMSALEKIRDHAREHNERTGRIMEMVCERDKDDPPPVYTPGLLDRLLNPPLMAAMAFLLWWFSIRARYFMVAHPSHAARHAILARAFGAFN